MNIDANNKKVCYFEAHAHAQELAIRRKATGLDLNTALDDANGECPTFEYHYRTAYAAARRAGTAAVNTQKEML